MDAIILITINEMEFEHSESLTSELILANVRKSGYQIKLFQHVYKTIIQDDLSGIAAKLIDNNPKLIYYFPSFDDLHIHVQISTWVKSMNINIVNVIGGSYASNDIVFCLQPEHGFDCLIPQYEFMVLPDLLEALAHKKRFAECNGLVYRSGKKIILSKAALPPNLDTIPIADRDMLAANTYTYLKMYSNIGCYWNCSFCWNSNNSSDRFSNPIHRSVPKIVDEMENLQRKHGVDTFAFVDDCFEVPMKERKLRTFCDELQKRNLQVFFKVHLRADNILKISNELMELLLHNGLINVFVGIESGYEPTLTLFNKKITVQENLLSIKKMKKYAIPMRIGFIMFHPYSTLEEYRTNCKFLHEIGQSYRFFQYIKRIILYKNSSMYMKVQADGLLKNDYSICNPYAYYFQDDHIKRIVSTIEKIFREYPLEIQLMMLLLKQCDILDDLIAKKRNRKTKMDHVIGHFIEIKSEIGNNNSQLFQNFSDFATSKDLFKQTFCLPKLKYYTNEIAILLKAMN